MLHFAIKVFVLVFSVHICSSVGNYGGSIRSYRPHSSGKLANGLPSDCQDFRLFHPAFPSSLRESLSYEEASRVLDLQSTLSSEAEAAAATNSIAGRLPWRVLPSIGAQDGQNAMSRAQLRDCYAENRHHGIVLWAKKKRSLDAGTVLLNNWSQQAVLVTSHGADRGATGMELVTAGDAATYTWPPLALDLEVAENKWQPVSVCERYHDALQYLPWAPRGAWELALVLLERDAMVQQALFDTGLCAQQGLVAYLRVVAQIEQRTEQWNDVPPHRKISERTILKQ